MFDAGLLVESQSTTVKCGKYMMHSGWYKLVNNGHWKWFLPVSTQQKLHGVEYHIEDKMGRCISEKQGQKRKFANGLIVFSAGDHWYLATSIG